VVVVVDLVVGAVLVVILACALVAKSSKAISRERNSIRASRERFSI